MAVLESELSQTYLRDQLMRKRIKRASSNLRFFSGFYLHLMAMAHKTGNGNRYEWDRISHRHWVAMARIAGLSKITVEGISRNIRQLAWETLNIISHCFISLMLFVTIND